MEIHWAKLRRHQSLLNWLRLGVRSPTRFRWLLTGLLLAVGLLGILWWPSTSTGHAALPFTTPDPVTAAWEKAKAAGSYHFTSDVTQVTIPLATLANVGRSSRSDTVRLEGQNNLRDQRLELTLWNDSGSVAAPNSGTSVKVENGQTFVRQGDGNWQLHDDAIESIAPQGDLMLYLTALRNVTALGQETRGPTGHAITCARYGFEIDAPRLAVYLPDQREAAARAQGDL
ncbi:MAG: hypothetical protein NT075_29905, partial [Chloroflexi bacterium]|nr:hypothetical protein [Chloroflexota bacterium]